MKIFNIVFSPTGGTQKVADIVAKAMGNEVVQVDLSNKDFAGCTIESSSMAVIAMPSFSGRAPMTAINRLKMIKADGAKAVVIAVYGNRAQEDTLIEMADAAKECGFDVVAGIEAIAEHSIVRQYATGRPNATDVIQLSEFAKQIAEKMANNASAAPQIPGNRPYKKSGAGLVPKATSACKGCGTCAKKCPVGAIDMANPKRVDKSICITCQRCVSVCPQGARKVNGSMKAIIGFVLKKPCSVVKENVLYL